MYKHVVSNAENETLEMKSIKIYLFIFLTIIFISCVKNERIEGKWFVEKFEKPNGEIKKSSEKWIDFLENGTLKGGKIGESEIKKGIWKFDSINKTLNIESEKEYGDSGVYKLEEINKKNMILVKDSMRIFFRKQKKNEH